MIFNFIFENQKTITKNQKKNQVIKTIKKIMVQTNKLKESKNERYIEPDEK